MTDHRWDGNLMTRCPDWLLYLLPNAAMAVVSMNNALPTVRSSWAASGRITMLSLDTLRPSAASETFGDGPEAPSPGQQVGRARSLRSRVSPGARRRRTV